MSWPVTFSLDLKCLAFGGPDGTKAYGLVQTPDVPVVVQAHMSSTDYPRLSWTFVTAGWIFQQSYELSGNTTSCVLNKAGELLAMAPWSGNQASSDRFRRGLVYNPYNPLPIVEGRRTSNALWMEVNPAANIDNSEREWTQLMIDTGADDNSALEIALTRSQILIRQLNASGLSARQLVGLGGWNLPRPLNDASTAQLQYSNKSLFVFTSYGANDTSLMRVPFNPNAAFSSAILVKPPTGTTSIDISSTLDKCNWESGYYTAVSGDKFYLLCQGREFTGTAALVRLFIYDNTTGTEKPKLGAAIQVNGLGSWTKINMFQPLKNKEFAMLACESYSGSAPHKLLRLSGSDIGRVTDMPQVSITVQYDTMYKNMLPNPVSNGEASSASEEDGVLAWILGVVLVLTAIIFVTIRYRRRQRSKRIRQKDAETAAGLHSSSALTAGATHSSATNTYLSPAVYAAPQVSIQPSPAVALGLPVSSWPSSPPTAAGTAPLASATLSPAPPGSSPPGTSSGSPPAYTYQMELQELGLRSHPRPNFVTTMND